MRTRNKRSEGGSARFKPAAIIAVAAAVVVITAFIAFRGGGGAPTAVKDADLVIPIADITGTARFYPVEVEGTKLEVIAVETPDGVVRTAFNTCQVCYDSGRGYYKQDGDALVCQNCGNRFRMDQVETRAGGCNPVPIFPENKIVTESDITIPVGFLTEAKVIFANWKA
jgi:uncharacterized membrane protein